MLIFEAVLLISTQVVVRHFEMRNALPEHLRNHRKWLLNKDFFPKYSKLSNKLYVHCKTGACKLPANANNFSCGPHVKTPHMQIICTTCSLPVKTGKITSA